MLSPTIFALQSEGGGAAEKVPPEETTRLVIMGTIMGMGENSGKFNRGQRNCPL